LVAPRVKWQTTRVSLLERLHDSDDAEAWRRFERSYGDVILRYACRRGLDLTDAEDVRQVVLLSMYRVMQSFRLSPERGRFRSYLGRVVGNAIQRHRTRAHHAAEQLEPDLTDFAPAVVPRELDALWEHEWTDYHLRTALAAIRSTVEPRTLDVFERLLRGDSVEDVARDTDRNVDAVRKVRQRIRARLQGEVRRQLAEEMALLRTWNRGERDEQRA
jgi:RNA polymerase sigma-70 factor (ECF subfamily)